MDHGGPQAGPGPAPSSSGCGLCPVSKDCLFARHRLRAQMVLFTVITKPKGGCYCSCFADKETEAQRVGCAMVVIVQDLGLSDSTVKPQSRLTTRRAARGTGTGRLAPARKARSRPFRCNPDPPPNPSKSGCRDEGLDSWRALPQSQRRDRAPQVGG